MALRLRVEQLPQGFERTIQLESTNESNACLTPSEQTFIIEEKQNQENPIPLWSAQPEQFEDFYYKEHQNNKNGIQQNTQRHLRLVGLQNMVRNMGNKLKNLCSKRDGQIAEQGVSQGPAEILEAPILYFSNLTPHEPSTTDHPTLEINSSQEKPQKPQKSVVSNFIDISHYVLPMVMDKYDMKPNIPDMGISASKAWIVNERVDSVSHAPKIARILKSSRSDAPKIEAEDYAPESIRNNNIDAQNFDEQEEEDEKAPDFRNLRPNREGLQRPQSDIDEIPAGLEDIPPQPIKNLIGMSRVKKAKPQEVERDSNPMPRIFNIPRSSSNVLITRRGTKEIVIKGQKVTIQSQLKEFKEDAPS